MSERLWVLSISEHIRIIEILLWFNAWGDDTLTVYNLEYLHKCKSICYINCVFLGLFARGFSFASALAQTGFVFIYTCVAGVA